MSTKIYCWEPNLLYVQVRHIIYSCTCCLHSNNQQLNITIRLPSATNIFCIFVNAVIQLALLDFFPIFLTSNILAGLLLLHTMSAEPCVNGTQWNESNTQYIYLLFTLNMFNLQHFECVRAWVCMYLDVPCGYYVDIHIRISKIQKKIENFEIEWRDK